MSRQSKPTKNALSKKKKKERKNPDVLAQHSNMHKQLFLVPVPVALFLEYECE